jgi:hypothetical protein
MRLFSKARDRGAAVWLALEAIADLVVQNGVASLNRLCVRSTNLPAGQVTGKD